MARGRVVLSCVDCRKVVMVVAKLQLPDLKRLRLHLGHHKHLTRAGMRRRIRVTVKDTRG